MFTIKQLSRWSLSMAAAAAIFASSAIAQTPTPVPPTSAPTPTPQEQQLKGQVDQFLINHPNEAEQLHQNPGLLNDPTWLSQHQGLKEFLDKNPGVQKQIAAHPQWFVNAAERSAMADARNQLNTTDRYLAQNPGLAKQLAANPQLIDNKQFLSQHPGLEKYLADHPEIRKDWMEHPAKFAQAAQANYRAHQDHTAPPARQKSH